VAVDRVYVDHGLTGTNRDHPGLAAALAMRRAVRRIRSGIGICDGVRVLCRVGEPLAADSS
jgi:hypothetical protein